MQYSIKLGFFIKYFLWYIFFNTVVSFTLVQIGIMKIPQNDSPIWYIFYQDVFGKILVFLLAVFGSILFNHVYSEKNFTQVLQKELVSFKWKIVIKLIDFILIGFVACLVVFEKLSGFSNIPSNEKLEIVPLLIIMAYFVKMASKSLGLEFLSLFNIILLALSFPVEVYGSLSSEVEESNLYGWKKTALKILIIFGSGGLVVYVLAGVYFSFKMNINIF